MNEIKLPFGFGEIIRNAPERAAAAIDEKDGMRLTALLLAPDMELEGDVAASLLDRGLVERTDGKMVVTPLGMKAVSLYPLFGHRTEKQLYPEAFFPFVLATAATGSLIVGRWHKSISSDFFTSLFPSIPRERVAAAAISSIERLIELGVIIEHGTELRIRKEMAGSFLTLGEEERLALIINRDCASNPEKLRRTALMIRASSLLSDTEKEYGVALIRKLTGLDAPLDELLLFSVIEEEGERITGRAMTDGSTEGLALSSDYSITYTGRTPPSIQAFATPVTADRTNEWKLTRESLKTAFSLGFTPGDVIAELRNVSSFPIPDTVLPRLDLWYSSYRGLRPMRAMILAADERNARIIDALPTMKMHIIEKLSDTVFLMDNDTEPLWRRALENAGFDMMGPTEGPGFIKDGKETPSLPCPSFSRAVIPPDREIPFDIKERDRLLLTASTPMERALILSGFIPSGGELDSIEMVNGLYYQEKMRLIHASEEGSKLYAEFTDGTVLIGRAMKTDDEHITILGKTIDAAKIWKVAMLPLSVRDLELHPSDSDSQ